MYSKLFLLPVVGLILATGPHGAKATPICLSEGSCNDISLPSKISERRWYDDPDWVPADDRCWSDNVDGVRALEYMIEECDQMTPDKCQWLCKDSGFSLAGVEYSRECWCGNTIFGNNHPISPEMCNSPCSGDPNVQCGGDNAINLSVRKNYVFTHGPAAPLESYNGYYRTQCFEDSIDDRVLDGRPAQEIPADYMTVERCIDGCKAAGFSSAGLEFGKECYCGDVQFPPSQYENLEDCNMPCDGDGSEYCGGPNRILIYQQPTTTTVRGIIQVIGKADNSVIGFISKHPVNGGAQFGYQPDEANAVHITFTTNVGATSVSVAELTMEDSDITAYPYLGLVNGRDNADDVLQSGSYQYGYIAATNTAPYGPATNVGNSYLYKQRDSESHTWNINLTTGDATLTWVNPDGTTPNIEYWLQSTGLYIGGDSNQFFGRYPAPITPIALKFLPRR